MLAIRARTLLPLVFRPRQARIKELGPFPPELLTYQAWRGIPELALALKSMLESTFMKASPCCVCVCVCLGAGVRGCRLSGESRGLSGVWAGAAFRMLIPLRAHHPSEAPLIALQPSTNPSVCV